MPHPHSDILHAIYEAMETGTVTLNNLSPQVVRDALIEARALLPDDDLGNVPRWRENFTTAIRQLGTAD